MIPRFIHYDEPLFRPPGEANSAILQVTTGCSWNRCAFCEMYTRKQFRVKSPADLSSDIQLLAHVYQGTRKVFLADGNAMVLSYNKLANLLGEIGAHFGKLQHVSSYALPRDILAKSSDELRSLVQLGLKLLYIGIETGDDTLLELVNKGETYQSTLEGIARAHEAGMDTSVMIITGLGGKIYSQAHASSSARLINAVQPKFLSTLTLSLPYGIDHFRSRFGGDYIPLSPTGILKETRQFIEELELESTIFRSNHVSNLLDLKGVLPRDKDDLIGRINWGLSRLSD